MTQWSHKLEDLTEKLGKELKTFLAPRLKDAKPADVAADLVKSAVKIDMNRSAARLRRMLYAQWGKLEMVAGEFYRLGPTGVEEREAAPSIRELGDLHIDPFRVMSVVKMLGFSGKNRLAVEDRVKGNHLILHTLQQQTLSKAAPLTVRSVGVLMTLHAVEANREVEKGAVVAQAVRHFPQWNLPVPHEDEVLADVQLLLEHGAIAETEDGARYRLKDRISYTW